MPELTATLQAVLEARNKRSLQEAWGLFLQEWLVARAGGNLQTRAGASGAGSFLASRGTVEVPVWAPVRETRPGTRGYPVFEAAGRGFPGSSEGLVLAVWLDRPYLRTESSWMRAGWGFLYRRHGQQHGLLQADGSFQQPPGQSDHVWGQHRCDTPQLLCTRVRELLDEAGGSIAP